MDPGFFDAWQSLRDFLKFFQSNAAIRSSWEAFVAHQREEGVRRTYGPFAKLMGLFAKLGWSLVTASTLDLGDGWQIQIPWLDSGMGKLLLEHFWQQYAISLVSHRKDMTGLMGINVKASFFEMKGLDHAQSELLNCIRDGTFHLGYHKSKFDPSVGVLCSCGQGEDTLEHRALHPDVIHLWHMLPDCMTHHGLAPANPWKVPLWKALSCTSWEAPSWQGGPPPLGKQLLYTDGSCSDQALLTC